MILWSLIVHTVCCVFLLIFDLLQVTVVEFPRCLGMSITWPVAAETAEFICTMSGFSSIMSSHSWVTLRKCAGPSGQPMADTWPRGPMTIWFWFGIPDNRIRPFLPLININLLWRLWLGVLGNRTPWPLEGELQIGRSSFGAQILESFCNLLIVGLR